jgi:pterin-4a-carbinolamine dehydratase
MYKVTYTVKNEDGYAVDKTKKFEQFQAAVAFIRELSRTGSKLIGKPVLEQR